MAAFCKDPPACDPHGMWGVPLANRSERGGATGVSNAPAQPVFAPKKY